MDTTKLNSTDLPTTLTEAVRYFADPDVSLQFMVQLRWSDGPECPTCGSKDVRFIPTRRIWECKCKHAKRQFSVKVGTIFEDSALPIDKWLIAIWTEANCKNSISSYELAATIGVTQKSAWFMQQRIRLAMQVGSFRAPLSGEVEVDETYIGGKARNMHASSRRKAKGRGHFGKAVVLGLLERHGQVRVKVVADNRRKTLYPLIREHVESGTTVFTDKLHTYDNLGLIHYFHHVIDHAECYVKGNVHTNGLENFWALFKRCIKGTHVSVEPFHLFRYLDAETFRFNNRKATALSRFLLAAAGIVGKRLTYKSLIGEAEKGLPPAMA
jgi:transposase-like protein